MIDARTVAEIDARVDAADCRYGPFASTHEALGVALEEWSELIDAVRSNNMSDVRHECMDLAAVCIRMAQSLDNKSTTDRSVK